jgi:hypothetical protein
MRCPHTVVGSNCITAAVFPRRIFPCQPRLNLHPAPASAPTTLTPKKQNPADMRTKTSAVIIAAAAQLVFPRSGVGAVMLTTSYSQNFDTLINSSSASWANDSTVPGWYSSESTYAATAGATTTGGLYSFGTGTSSDRAFGSIASSSTATIYFGAAFQNSSGSTINALTISYRGEQWRAGNNVNTLLFEYFIGTPSAINSGQGGWTPVSSLNFSSLQTSGSSAALDGNSAANYADISYTITGLNIANAGAFWIRWRDVNESGDDAAMGIDNLSVSVPEPTNTALTIFVCGLISAGGVARWRNARRKHGAVSRA